MRLKKIEFDIVFQKDYFINELISSYIRKIILFNIQKLVCVRRKDYNCKICKIKNECILQRNFINAKIPVFKVDINKNLFFKKKFTSGESIKVFFLIISSEPVLVNLVYNAIKLIEKYYRIKVENFDFDAEDSMDLFYPLNFTVKNRENLLTSNGHIECKNYKYNYTKYGIFFTTPIRFSKSHNILINEIINKDSDEKIDRINNNINNNITSIIDNKINSEINKKINGEIDNKIDNRIDLEKIICKSFEDDLFLRIRSLLYELLKNKLKYLDPSYSCQFKNDYNNINKEVLKNLILVDRINLEKVHDRIYVFNNKKKIGVELYTGYIEFFIFNEIKNKFLKIIKLLQYLGIGKSISYGFGKFKIFYI